MDEQDNMNDQDSSMLRSDLTNKMREFKKMQRDGGSWNVEELAAKKAEIDALKRQLGVMEVMGQRMGPPTPMEPVKTAPEPIVKKSPAQDMREQSLIEMLDEKLEPVRALGRKTGRAWGQKFE